jgi:hypothetical protein
MQNSAGRSRLLDEILGDEETMRFRGELEEQCLQHMKERRGRIVLARTLRMAAGILVVCIGAYLVGQHARRTESVTIVETRDFDEGDIAVERFTTEALRSSTQSATHAAATLRSGESRAERISEREMLEHYLGHPLALVRRPGMHAELVFLDPADDARFFAGRLRS